MQLKYKSYLARVYFSALTNCFYGEVIANDDHPATTSIVFLASNKHALMHAFQQAVEQQTQCYHEESCLH